MILLRTGHPLEEARPQRCPGTGSEPGQGRSPGLAVSPPRQPEAPLRLMCPRAAETPELEASRGR